MKNHPIVHGDLFRLASALLALGACLFVPPAAASKSMPIAPEILGVHSGDATLTVEFEPGNCGTESKSCLHMYSTDEGSSFRDFTLPSPLVITQTSDSKSSAPLENNVRYGIVLRVSGDTVADSKAVHGTPMPDCRSQIYTEPNDATDLIFCKVPEGVTSMGVVACGAEGGNGGAAGGLGARMIRRFEVGGRMGNVIGIAVGGKGIGTSGGTNGGGGVNDGEGFAAARGKTSGPVAAGAGGGGWSGAWMCHSAEMLRFNDLAEAAQSLDLLVAAAGGGGGGASHAGGDAGADGQGENGGSAGAFVDGQGTAGSSMGGGGGGGRFGGSGGASGSGGGGGSCFDGSEDDTCIPVRCGNSGDGSVGLVLPGDESAAEEIARIKGGAAAPWALMMLLLAGLLRSRRHLLLGVGTAVCLLGTLPAQASDDAYAGILGSVLARDSDLPVDTGYGLHLLAGMRLTPALLGELSLHGAQTPVSGLSEDISLAGIGLDVLYPFAAGTLQPFLLAGLGVQRDDFRDLGDSETSPYVNLGAGLFAPLAGNWRLRAEARGIAVAYDDFPGADTALDARLNIGVTYAWNTSGPAPRAAPEVDADGDGVADAADACPGTPAGQAVTDNGCVRLDGLQLRLNFARASARLDAAGRKELDRVAEALNAAPGLRVEIAGHTDSRGDAQKNVALSQQRADAVRDYLIARGVDGQRLEARGYGAAQPVDSNDTAEGRHQNRRVELRTLP